MAELDGAPEDGALVAVSDIDRSAWSDWPRFAAEQDAVMSEARKGWAVAAVLAFLSGLIGISYWYAEVGAPVITSAVGFAAFTGVVAGLFAMTLSRGLLGEGGWTAALVTALGRGFYQVAKPLKGLDLFLRHGVGAACGLELLGRRIRYLILFAHLGGCGALLWAVPLYWPQYAWVGYAGLAWAFLALVAVVRQRAWIGEEYDRHADGWSDGQALRLPDLRDQAVFCLLLLFATIPVLLWRLNQSFDLFTTKDGAPARAFDWAAFFGGEALRALPLGNWAEVYGARSALVISPVAPYGVYAEFAIRALVDIMLVSGLLYGLDRIGRMARQWSGFLAGDRRFLDPALERRAIRMLKTLANRAGGLWLDQTAPTALGPFANYNANRLQELARDDNATVAAIAVHAAFAQSPKAAFLPIAREVFADEKRHRSVSLKTAMLLTDLLGRTNDGDARELLERILASFEGRSADATWRVRCHAAIAIVTAWRIAPAADRTEALENEVVERLRYGLQRNRDRDPQIRVTIGDQLSIVGGGPALEAITSHLEYEMSSIVLVNLAADMQRMIPRAPSEPLRRASGVLRLRSAVLQAKGRRSDSDKLAARALIQTADAIDKVLRDQKREAVMGPQRDMVLVEPVLERA
jgi:hypothetical protein